MTPLAMLKSRDCGFGGLRGGGRTVGLYRESDLYLLDFEDAAEGAVCT
jgi:hypothetical protein